MVKQVACPYFLMVVLLVGCGDVSVWRVDPLVKVFPDDEAGTGRSAGPLLMARGGHGTVQIAVRSAEGIEELGVEVESPLEATARWVDYVPVGSNTPRAPDEELVRRAPALFPDPLREEFPFELPAGRTHAVWITLHAPSDTEPGEYSGEVALLSGGERVGSVDFAARVTQATVPAEQRLRVTNWFNFGADNFRRFDRELEGDSERYWELLENLGRVMAEHRQSVILTPVSSLARPELVGGRLRYDFSRFDQWVETFERAGIIGTIEGGHLLGRRSGYASPIVVPAWVIEGGKPARVRLEPDDPRGEQYLRSFLTALYAHLKNKGWENRYIQHVHDEPHDREAPIYNRYTRIVRESLPGVPTIDAVSLNQDIGFFEDVLDIWVPVLGSFDHKLDVIGEHVQGGGQAWFYTCVFPQGRYLNRFIDYSLLKVRLLHWFNFRYDFTGFLHWGGNYWGPRPFENVQSVINSNRTLLPPGDNALVYPNPAGNSVLSSIRLEAMRDGIEDYELLAELAQSKPELAKDLAARMIPNINDYTRDVAEFRAGRRELLEAFE